MTLEKKKPRLNKIDIYIIFSIVMMLIYTIVDKIILIRTGLSNDTLTNCFFLAFGGELFCSCVIKSLNIRNEPKINPTIDPEPIDSKGDGIG